MSPMIIDAHAHCGRLDRFPPQDLPDYRSCLHEGKIGGFTAIPPVIEIYDRYDPGFRDTPQWQKQRAESNSYLLGLNSPDFTVYPFFFIWNDFAVEGIRPGHKGIKWHRHSDEPVYNYNDQRCAAAIEEIRRRNMPVLLEEEFANTLFFINELAPGVAVIIPHLGYLNGGYESLRRRGIFEMPNIYADTALAPAADIKDYIDRYGHERIMFGSDFPFGDPESELAKVLRLKLNDDQMEAVLGGNIINLLSGSNP